MNAVSRKLFGALALLCIVQAASAQAVWWNSSYPYRAAVNVSTNSYDRTDWIVEKEVNFSALIYSATGSLRDFDNNSIRVIEYTSSGSIMNTNNNLGLISQFIPASGYNSTRNAFGELVWLLNGTTPSSSYRYFYVYFSDLSSPKANPSYQTNLTYSWDGREMSVNNSRMRMRLDTAHGSLNTSGIYYVRVNSTVVFDASSSDRSFEYISYMNDLGNTRYTYDLRGIANVLVAGPLKIVMEQKGQEAAWNNPNSKTNQANLTKRYSFYEGQTYVYVNQTLRNTAGADIGRGTYDSITGDNPSALSLDVDNVVDPSRFLAWTTRSCSLVPGSCGVGEIDNSWWYAYPFPTGNPPLNRGVGIVNYFQSTANYWLGVNLPDGRFGLGLTLMTITTGSQISQASYLQFDDRGNDTGYNATRELWRRTVDSPISVEQGSSESWNLSFFTFANYTVYNRNETVFVYLNLTDAKNVVDKVNATFDMGTGSSSDDSTISLSETSPKFFVGQFVPNSTAQTGRWNYTVRLYDGLSQLVNTTAGAFNVTDRFNVNLTVLNPFGPVLDQVLANVSVMNFRNDTPIPASGFACDYNSTSIAGGMTDYGGGRYLLNFTSSSTVGNFTLTCNALKGGNNGTAFGFYYREAQTTTVLDMQSPQYYTANNITHNVSESFYFNVTLANAGLGNAYSLNLSLSAPAGWLLNSTNETCGVLPPGSSCTRLFRATIPNKTLSGLYAINSTAFWGNANFSLWNYTNLTVVNVSSNRILYVKETGYALNISHGTLKWAGNVTVFSFGNDPLLDLNLSTYNLSGFTTLFNPPNLSSLSSGLNSTFAFNTSIPVGFDFGVYPGFVNVSTSNGGYRAVPYAVEVPVNRSWWRDLSNCAVTTTTPTGLVCTIVFNNTGNANISFQASPNASNYTNYTAPSPDNFTIPKQSVFSVQILYDATGVNTEDTFNTTYNFSALEPEAIPMSRLTVVRLTTRLGPVFNFTSFLPPSFQQLDGLSMFITVFDRGQKGLNRTIVNVTAPSGIYFVSNMTNSSPFSMGYNLSNWTASFPAAWGNTTEKGFYNIRITVWDNYGAYNEYTAPFMVYTNLNVTLRAFQGSYRPGDLASVYYFVDEIDSAPVPNVSVNLTVRNPSGFVVREYSYVTRASGLAEPIPTYDIPADSVGTYTLQAVSKWDDPVYNVTVNRSLSNNFSVALPSSLSADIVTNEAWASGNVSFAFIIQQTEDFRTERVDPDWVNFTIRTQNSSVWAFHSFNVSELLLQNRTGNLSRESAGFYFFDSYFPNTSAGTYSAELEVGWGNKTASSAKTFEVSFSNQSATLETLFTDIATTVVWYPSSVMKFDFLVYDHQKLVDPDNMTFVVRDPANNVYINTWYPNSPASANITRVSAGHYLLQYAMGANTSTGAYLADLKAYSGTLQSEKLRMFRVASGGPYDVRINLLQSEVARGQQLPVEFIAENKGEVGQDIIMDYWVTDSLGATQYSQLGEAGYTPVLQNTTFPRSIPIFSSQPLGISYLTLVVKYDVTQAPIRVNATFLVVEANVSVNITPSPGPGGGGGPPSAPVVISNVTNVTAPPPPLVPRLEFTSYKQDVNAERGSEKYATFTIRNSGEKALHNITLDFSGIPFDWYSTDPVRLNSLRPGESTSFMVKFLPSRNAEPRQYSGRVSADSEEVSASQDFSIRVFASKEELIQFEINRLYDKIEELRGKADDAQSVGKNVTEALSLLDEAENQLGYAERYLGKRMYSNSLIVINTIDNLLERAKFVIDNAKFTPIAPQQKITITTEFPDWILYLLLMIIVLIIVAVLYWMRQSRDIERLLVTHDSGRIKEAVADSENFHALEAEKERIKDFLRTIDREYDAGMISQESYDELRRKNRDRLLALSLKIYAMKAQMKDKAGTETG